MPILPFRRAVLGLAIALLSSPVALLGATRTWTGLGADTNWTTAGNWTALPVAGDDLVFPGGVPAGSQTNNNDFPAGTSFASIAITASGYTLNGNQVALGTSGLSTTTGATINLAFSLASTATFTATGFVNLFGVISGPAGVTSNGPGTPRLFAPNTYSGLTTINAGAFSIENSQPVSSIVVNSGGTLTGSNAGSMGPVTVNPGGTVDPGVSPGSAAIITINGPLTMSAGSTFVADLIAALSFDRVAPSGTINLAGSTLVVNPTFVPPLGTPFNIISNSGAGAIVGTFAGLPEGTVFAAGGSSFSISYVAGDGNDVTLTTVGPPITGTPTATPTATPTSTATVTPSSTPTVTGSPTLTPTPTVTGSPTLTPTPGQPSTTVPTLSMPMLGLLALGLALAALLLIHRR